MNRHIKQLYDSTDAMNKLGLVGELFMWQLEKFLYRSHHK